MENSPRLVLGFGLGLVLEMGAIFLEGNFFTCEFCKIFKSAIVKNTSSRYICSSVKLLKKSINKNSEKNESHENHVLDLFH